MSLTGDCADTGELARRGVELGIDEINSKGGVLGRPFKAIVEDTHETSSAHAITAYEHLVLNSHARFLIGPSCSSAGLAVAPIAARNKDVVLISPSIGVRQFNEAGGNIFKLWPYDEAGPRLVAQYAFSKGFRRGAIFSSTQVWCEAQGNFFEQEFKRLGGEIVVKEEPVQGTTDLRGSALKIARSKPDFVFLSNFLDYDIAARELTRQGYTGPKLSSLMTEEKIVAAQGALEGTVAFGYEPASTSFLERFKSRYGKAPWSIGADTAYDAVQLYAAAMQRAGSDDPVMVQRELLSIQNHPGASGTLSFDEHGGVTRPPELYIVRGGNLTKVPRNESPTGK